MVVGLLLAVGARVRIDTYRTQHSMPDGRILERTIERRTKTRPSVHNFSDDTITEERVISETVWKKKTLGPLSWWARDE